MTLNILAAVDYEVKFDRDTRDYAVTVDQQFIGYTSTYVQGEALAREHIYDLMERGLISDDPRELGSDADFEVPNYKLSPAQRAWLARQLGVVVLPSKELVLHALANLQSNALNDNAARAYHRAAQAIAAGAYPQRDGKDWLVTGSKGDVYRVVNRRCKCQAAQNRLACFHSAMVRGVEKAMNGGGR